MMIKKIHTGLIRPIRQVQGRQAHSGLTIMEILVAVAIIAILAAGLYSVSNHFEKQAKVNITQSTIETLVTAIEQYRDFKGSFPPANALTAAPLNGTITVAADYNNIMYESSDALYFYLNKIPASRKILDSVKDVASVKNILITDKDYKGEKFTITIGTETYPLIHILDAWGTPLRYTYNAVAGDNFPVIESAGPDKDFNKTADNLSSK